MVAQAVRGLFPSFVPGDVEPSGDDLGLLAELLFDVQTGIVTAGASIVNAIQIDNPINEITSGGTAQTVELPPALVGQIIWVVNSTTSTKNVFACPANPFSGKADLLILHSVATATTANTLQSANIVAIYICVRPGVWKQGWMT